MKIGRNDPCPCGSGKKYKQCCLSKSVSGNDYKRIREVVIKNNYEDSIGNILCNLLRYMKEKNWIGACHATSAALYVALTEAGYSVDLCVGEVEFSRFVFDHSWIELDNKIIDLAVSMTLMGGGMSVSEPIVLDTNIATGDRCN